MVGLNGDDPMTGRQENLCQKTGPGGNVGDEIILFQSAFALQKLHHLVGIARAKAAIAFHPCSKAFGWLQRHALPFALLTSIYKTQRRARREDQSRSMAMATELPPPRQSAATPRLALRRII